MKKITGLALLVSLGLVSATVAPAAQRVPTTPLSVELAPGDGRPLQASRVADVAEAGSGNLLPVLFFDEHGQIFLTRMSVEGNDLQQIIGKVRDGNACNGGSCAAGGLSLNCPTSGGPTCQPGQSCQCVCVPGNMTTSTENKCV